MLRNLYQWNGLASNHTHTSRVSFNLSSAYDSVETGNDFKSLTKSAQEGSKANMLLDSYWEAHLDGQKNCKHSINDEPQ